MKDQIGLKGKVELFVTKGKVHYLWGKKISPSGIIGGEIYSSCTLDFSQAETLDKFVAYNIILDIGKDNVISSLVSGNVQRIGRMAIGDRGTIPSDPSVPKVPPSDLSSLYNEVYRDDVDGTALDVGGTEHKVQFVKTFSAIDVPITAFSNQANPIINEVGLITYDQAVQPLPRPPVAAPGVPPADEAVFSLRTFKSVPFEAANEISVTIRYTIFIA